MSGKAEVVVVAESLGVAPDQKRSDWIIERAGVLVHTVKASYLELGERLVEIQDWRLYRLRRDPKDGQAFPSFEDYVEIDLGIAYTKAKYLMSIHRRLVLEGKVPRIEMVDLEWSRAAVISKLPPDELTPKKAREWVAEAKVTSTHDLKVKVAKAKNDAVGRKVFSEEPSEPMKFYLFSEQAKIVRRALDLAGRAAKSDKPGRQLELICLEFLTQRAESREVKLNELLAGVERIFGVRCLAVEDGKDAVKIVYGRAAAKELGVEE